MVVEVSFVPSVIALLERREARAREELNAWQELLREAQEQVGVHQERVERARIGCEEVLRALAEEAEAGIVEPLTAAVPAVCAPALPSAPEVPQELEVARVEVSEPTASALRWDYDPRPPVWRPGLGVEALAGVYRQVFDVVAGAGGPVAVKALTLALGRDAERLNEIEKVRHRAYALQARGWLRRVPGGLFIPAQGLVPPAGGGGTRASARAGGPSAARG
ncbi:hypothetical protein [Streptacidiphilus sp. PAMC 29251]